MDSLQSTIRIVGVVFLGFLILAIASGVAQGISESSLFQQPTVAWVMPTLMHLSLVVLSLTCMLIFGRGQLRRFGFTCNLPAWTIKAFVGGLGIGLAVNFLLYLLNLNFDLAKGYTLTAIIVLIWCWASLCEEIFCRGLLQTLFEMALQRPPAEPSSFSRLPIILAAVFFALMHLPLLMLGVAPAAVAILIGTAFLLGFIAGYLRQRTTSLLPAVLVHAIFNISGSLVDWIVT